MRHTTCVRCGSDRIRPVVYDFFSVRPGLAIASEARPLRAPLDETSPNWECAACGSRWPDDERLEAAREIRATYERLRTSRTA